MSTESTPLETTQKKEVEVKENIQPEPYMM